MIDVHSVFFLKPQTKAVCIVVLTIFIGGCVAKVPFVHGTIDRNGPEYTSTFTTPLFVPVMFKLDGRGNVFAAKRAHLAALGKNATVLYFLPRTATVTESSLNAQVQDIWTIMKPKLSKGDLDILILREMSADPALQMNNYVFVKDDKGRWARLKDGDYIDRIIKSQF